MHKRYNIKGLRWTDEHTKSGERDSFDEIMNKLKDSGFFDELSKNKFFNKSVC